MKRTTPEHPKLLDLCARLHMRRWEAVGILELIWHFTAKYAPAGDIGKYPDSTIAKAIDWGRAPERLIDALVESRWLDRCECHRLLIHDWPDHADDSVHMKLARSCERFADGTTPCTRRLPKDEKTRADAYYMQNPCARKAHGVQLAEGKPLPLPKPVPKPVPRPEPDGDTPSTSPAGASEAFDFHDRFERIYARHPKKGDRGIAERYLSESVAAGLNLDVFDVGHSAWCDSEEWRWKNGAKAPKLAQFILDNGWKYPPPREDRPLSNQAKTEAWIAELEEEERQNARN